MKQMRANAAATTTVLMKTTSSVGVATNPRRMRRGRVNNRRCRGRRETVERRRGRRRRWALMSATSCRESVERCTAMRTISGVRIEEVHDAAVGDGVCKKFHANFFLKKCLALVEISMLIHTHTLEGSNEVTVAADVNYSQSPTPSL